MNREEATLLGFEIVAYAGDARSKLLEALNAAQAGEYDRAEELVAAADDCIVVPIKLKQAFWLRKHKVMILNLVLL